MKEINIRDIKTSPVELLNDGWGLVAAGNESGYNMMTVSWGAIGEIWNMDAAIIFIRPQRYTYEYLEKEEYFTLSFYSPEHKNALSVCGSKSGRDCDKAKEAGLTPDFTDGTITFKEAKYTLVCKKAAGQILSSDGFIDKSINQHYHGDCHKMYIGQIIKVYENK